MYVVMAHIIGKGWGVVAIEPHEECVVNMISYIDSQFGDGTAWAGKLPDKDTPEEIAETEQHSTDTQNDLLNVLKEMESGSMDLNAAFAELNKREND